MSRARPIVAIDGPVGAGKSTVARELARALGFTYLNTGAMYRAVAIAALNAGLSGAEPDIERRLAPILAAIRIEFMGERIVLNRRDISGEIAAPDVSDLASRLSALGAVRARMRELQRKAGEKGGVVMEGRDVGTAVFPDAEFKFYLDADVRERARRRFEELSRKGTATTLDEVLGQLIERDQRDSGRELAPLQRANDALVIDSTNLGAAQVVARMKKKITERINAHKDLKPE